MSDFVRETICQMVTQRGVAILDDPSKIRALLADLCPSQRAERYVVVAALEQGVPSQLRSFQERSVSHLVDRVAVQLRLDTGVGEKESRWAVESIALAMGVMRVGDLDQQTSAANSKEGSTATPHYIAKNSKPVTDTQSAISNRFSPAPPKASLQTAPQNPIQAAVSSASDPSNAQVSTKNGRRVIAVLAVIAVIFIVGFVVSGKLAPVTTTTLAGTETTLSTPTPIVNPNMFGPISQPSPVGTFGRVPKILIPSGAPPRKLESRNLITGTGLVARAGDTITVEYVLGTYAFKGIARRSTQPFTFVLNRSSVGLVWADGLLGMRVGGRRELIVPPRYGLSSGTGTYGVGISPHDTLIYIVDLHKVVAH